MFAGMAVSVAQANGRYRVVECSRYASLPWIWSWRAVPTGMLAHVSLRFRQAQPDAASSSWEWGGLLSSGYRTRNLR